MAKGLGMAQRKKAMLAALEKSLGIVSVASQSVGVPRETHYRWMRNDAKYAKAVEDLAEVAIDFAESSLFKQIKALSPAATIFFLKTKARDRGYIERRDVDVTSKGESVAPPKPPIAWTDEEDEGAGL
jgi:hypothetical protein